MGTGESGVPGVCVPGRRGGPPEQESATILLHPEVVIHVLDYLLSVNVLENVSWKNMIPRTVVSLLLQLQLLQLYNLVMIVIIYIHCPL